MLPLVKFIRKTVFSLVLSSLVLVAAFWIIPIPSAEASIHAYPLETPLGQGTMVRSLQAFRDNRDRGWQAVLFFNTVNNQVTEVHIRLSGFPGTVVDRSQPLRVKQGTQTWELPDAFDVTGKVVSATGNTGEYDAAELMRSLEQSRPMTLTLSLAAGDVDIILPPFAVKEWLKLREQATRLKI